MDRKKAIRTTEATDRSLIPAVHSVLVVTKAMCLSKNARRLKRKK